MRLEDRGLLGNCQYSALIENFGAVVWYCLPRFDVEPVFTTLLDEHDGGQFLIGPADDGRGVQRYLDKTNILETVFRSSDSAIRVLDFAPRFIQHERLFRPTQLFRLI